MANNDKVISREESRSFDRYLFDTDFFEIDVAAAEEKALIDQAIAEASNEANPDANQGDGQTAEGMEAGNDQLEPAQPPAITKEDLAQAESAGYAAGLADGKAQASEDFKQQINTHVGAFAESLKQIDLLKEELSAEMSQKAVRLLAGLLPSLMADAQENYPETILKRTADKLLDTLREEKVLAVKTAPDTKEFLLNHIAEAEGLKANLKANLKPEHFKESPELEVGDCIIEWENGGLTLSQADILQQLTDILLAASPSYKKKQKEAVRAQDLVKEEAEQEPQQATEQPAEQQLEQQAGPAQEDLEPATPDVSETPETDEAQPSEEIKQPEPKE